MESSSSSSKQGFNEDYSSCNLRSYCSAAAFTVTATHAEIVEPASAAGAAAAVVGAVGTVTVEAAVGAGSATSAVAAVVAMATSEA